MNLSCVYGCDLFDVLAWVASHLTGITDCYSDCWTDYL